MSFSLDLTKFIKKTKGNANLIVRKVGLDVTKGVIKRTPIDTGRARAGWQVDSTIPTTISSKTDKTGNATLRKAMTEINGIDAGGVFFIYNNVEYIQKLEVGTSKQAPHGMVRTTLSLYQQYLDNAVKGLK